MKQKEKVVLVQREDKYICDIFEKITVLDNNQQLDET